MKISLKKIYGNKIVNIVGAIFIFFFILSLTGISVSSLFAPTPLHIGQEAFVNSGEYPLADDELLLYNDYTVAADGGGISPLNASDIYTEYPVFPADSLETNNIRYWSQPDNGTCTPPEMCGGLYAPTKQNIPPPAKPPSWNEVEPRVNFYASI